MKIGINSYDTHYKELFKKESDVQEAITFDRFSLDDSKNTFDCLVIDGKTTSYQTLADIRGVYADIPIFYKMHDVKSDIITKNIQRICAAHKIKPINEHYTVEQVVETVTKAIFERDEEDKRVVSFFGTHSGVGVSTTVFSVAKSISERVHEKVLVLSLNAWDPADYFTTYNGKYLNDLKIDLKTKSLTVPKLNEALHQQGPFYHLAGNRDIKLQRYYKNEEIAHLIEVAKEGFDLILIDGGTHFDTAIASQSYIASELRFIVTNQDDKGYRGYFPLVFQQMIEPSGGKREDFMLIINRFRPNISLITDKHLEEDMEINKIAAIPDMDILGAVSIHQKKLLYDLSDSTYRNNIDSISNLIIQESKLNEKPRTTLETSTRKGFFSFFRKREGERV